MAYRKEITRLRSQRLAWDQEELVKSLIRDVGFPCAKECAAQGWRNLRRAELKPSSKDVDSSIVPSAQDSDEICFLNRQLRSRKVDKLDSQEDEDVESQDEEQAPVTMQQVGENSDAELIEEKEG